MYVCVCVFINNKIAKSWEPASLTEVNSFVAFFAHKSPCTSHSTADTTSCLDRGSSLLSPCSTQATGLPGTWMLKQLWNNNKVKNTLLVHLLVMNQVAKVTRTSEVYLGKRKENRCRYSTKEGQKKKILLPSIFSTLQFFKASLIYELD